MCVYINTKWGKNCSLLVEFVIVICRQFYLPWEFPSTFVAAIYIPPSASAKEAVRELYGAISEQQNKHPNGLFIVACDFNHADLRSVLPKLFLDLVYSNTHLVQYTSMLPSPGPSSHAKLRSRG